MDKNNKEEKEEVMDTPERSKSNQIATSIGKFEDSPVFNFLNSLSPIKPIKSIPITQTINPLTFALIPSVFTSPYMSSLRECKFLRRHQLSDPTKPEFSSEDVNMIKTDKVNKLDEHKENIDPSYEYSKLGENFDYDCFKAKSTAEYACDSLPLVQLRDSYTSEIDLQNEEGTSCGDWEGLTSDPSDLIIFESLNNETQPCKKSVDPATSFYRSIKNAIQNTLSRGQESFSTEPGEGSEMMENAETHDMNACSSVANPIENMDYQHLSGSYRGMRRRCLVFEKAGARMKYLAGNSNSDSSILQQSDGNISSNQQIVPINTANDSSLDVLPGIGLHLNSIAATSNDYEIVDHDASSSRRLLIGPSSYADFQPRTCSQELLSDALHDYSLDREIDTVENGVLPLENEDINQSSPKKKRRRLEQAGEGESCKRCNCKKSKCLKLYCECFAAGVYCVEPCACIDCFNKPIHEDTVLQTRKQIESRNPLAFAPKVIRGSESLSETADDFSKTPASARHKRGCNCKKSGCLKKYCECYQGGVGCSVNCRCEGCKNAFGRKDGCGVINADHEFEEDETNTAERAEMSRSFQKTTIRDNIEQSMMDSALPATPLRTGRFLSKERPPKSSFSSSTFSANQGFGESSFFPPPPSFNKPFEDEMPEFLLETSPNRGIIKTSSPNGKRVCSPSQRPERSPGSRSSRKLILRSIPSFPSLTHNQ